ncbi:hypothetical protein BKN38_08625 [Helicobacter sp. CLO-3]|uniref:aminotransferase class I/II-fold pyridoxal phosphate-dependent enzyme n=1 Tax=unclassified Helicobacter TaxID=2593540 RepID=UPI0008047BE1|nr:pyridoxal phosphate-dependent aminotransferase family protein [Helicobacter sp. 'CLO3_human']OBV29139.1 hypothetical protein BA723_06630 [Helicobacter sp. CLO-3]OHU81638.1 hypothetical protein BKN38_08625 [Helicobacter sp. CLO-3]
MPRANDKNDTINNTTNHTAQAENDARAILTKLAKEQNLREIKDVKHSGIYIYRGGQKLLNFASNDYLGIACDDVQNCAQNDISSGANNRDKNRDKASTTTNTTARASTTTRFLDFARQNLPADALRFGSSSSRLLSGGFEINSMFEAFLQSLYAPQKALLFNSGYHLNISCIAALSELESSLFLADEYIHASIIDGLRLCRARFRRFRHNDMGELRALLESNHAQYRHIFILSEGIFSMEGDFAPLKSLIALKHTYKNAYLYLDEAHSIGVCGEQGLGLAHALGVSGEVDFLVLAFGKAIASVGACMICSADFREFFVNRARALIYSTAIAPINVAFSYFSFKEMIKMQARRQKLASLSAYMRENLGAKAREMGLEFGSALDSGDLDSGDSLAGASLDSENLDSANLDSGAESKKVGSKKVDSGAVLGALQIISLVLGSNERALSVAKKLESSGFFAPAIKAPSVPANTARIRFCLNAGMEKGMIDALCEAL